MSLIMTNPRSGGTYDPHTPPKHADRSQATL